MERTGHTHRLARLNAFVLLMLGGSLLAWMGGNCGGVPLTALDPNAGLTDSSGRPVLGDAADNVAPTLTFVQPSRDLVVDRGLQVLVEWDDVDPDNNAVIEVTLDRDGIPNSGNEVSLVSDRLEDGDGFQHDRYILDTATLQYGNYIVRARISDAVNSIVQVQAPGLISVVPPGTGPRNTPPTLAVLTPDVDSGVAQGDTLVITWQAADADDFDAELVVLFDKDNDPDNDNPADPAESGVIVLPNTVENANPRLVTDAGTYTLTVDVSQVPVRESGDPYYVRVTVSDGVNPPVHRYAPGLIRVLGMASGTVDLAGVGKTIMGARWLGFNPGAMTGSRVRTVTDADGDGIEDCCIIARFGIPFGRANIGEAWLLFGRDGERFGGDINVNSIGSLIRGHVFTAPPPSVQNPPNELPRTEGITDVVAIPNIDTSDADALPELVFGLPHVDGLSNGRDDDPADLSCDPSNRAIYCDPFGQNISDAFNDGVGPDGPPGGESLGFVSLVSSSGFGGGSGSVIALGNAGQGGGRNGARWQPCIFDPRDINQVTGGLDAAWPITVCETGSPGFPALNPIAQPGAATVNAHWGQTVDVLHDVNSDGIPELVISAPKNMLDIEYWRSQYPALLPSIDPLFRAHPHLPTDGDISGEFPGVDGRLGGSRFYEGNVIVFFGQDWINLLTSVHSRGSRISSIDGDENGTMSFPFFPAFAGDNPWDPFCCLCGDFPDGCDGLCTVRALTGPAFFEVAGEKASDELGGGRSAGDFNLDGPGDLLVGAPFADHGDWPDVGAAYILYGRLTVGNLRLSDLNNAQAPRPPSVRIFGDQPHDHFGSWQESVQDFNGDRIEDVLIASGDADGPKGVDSGMVAVLFGGQQVTGDFLASELATPELRGIRFYGAHPGARAGANASTAGDFNGDGFGDLLITAPGETRVAGGLVRRGVVYLIFGGPHLDANRVITLDLVGRPYEDTNGNGVLDAGEDSNVNGLLDPYVPGAVFISPYQLSSLDEAAPSNAAFVGDMDGDGFDDIMIGNPEADFIDPEAPTQRRPDAGEAYLIYGNNAGTNSLVPQGIVSGP